MATPEKRHIGLEWLNKAAQAGDACAHFNLGELSLKEGRKSQGHYHYYKAIRLACDPNGKALQKDRELLNQAKGDTASEQFKIDYYCCVINQCCSRKISAA